MGLADQIRGQILNNRELQTLLLAGQALAQEQDEEQVCLWACDALTSLLGTTLAAIALQPRERDRTARVYGKIGDSPLDRSLAEELAGLAEAEWSSHRRHDGVAVLRGAGLPPVLSQLGTGSLAWVPVRTIQRELGLLLVGGVADRDPGAREEFVLSTLANQAALALENGRLRREATEQAQTLQALIQAAPLAIISRDLDARVRMWNPAAQRIFGWREEEVLGRPYPLVPEGKQDEYLANMQLALSGKGLEGLETVRQRKDGGVLDVRIWTAPLGDSGTMVVIADISDQKRAEEAQRGIAVLEERNRLARDLHDSVTQSLFSLTLFTEAARRLSGSGDWERTKEYLTRLGETSLQALKEMRLLVHELRPLELASLGLVGALQQRLDAVEGRAGVVARLLVSGTIDLEDHLEEELFRVAQEAMNNALKHAAAPSVTVRITADTDGVDLEIEDTGRGFDPAVAEAGGGMGLASMQERIFKLGGSLDILSAPGEGTRVKVRVEIK